MRKPLERITGRDGREGVGPGQPEARDASHVGEGRPVARAHTVFAFSISVPRHKADSLPIRGGN